MAEAIECVELLQTLYRIAHAVNSSLDMRETLEAILRSVVEELHLKAAIIRLLSPDAQELRLMAAAGLSSAYLQKGSVRVAESGVDQQVLAGEIVFIPDVTTDPRFQYPEEARREGIRAVLALPLQVRERSIGVLRAYCAQECEFNNEERTLLRAVADLGAVAIENARLHTALFRIAEALNSTLDLKEMLQRVLAAVVMEMNLKAASVRLLDRKEKTLELAAAHGLSEAYLAKGRVLVAQSPIDQRVLAGEPVTLFDVEEEPGFQYPAEAAAEGIRSVLAVPLRVKDKTVGVMRVYSTRPRHFGPVGIRFLSAVADLVAIAIENARLYEALQASYEDLKLDVGEWYRFLSLG
ncbi:MAG TPA: GAF domain-containing protein [Anaerolineae bacterium]|nr:GAF domain-containing protein [Anaerolineae bacterium]